MTRYNHALFFGFSVISDHPEGEDISGPMIRTALVNRLNSISDSELGEACLPPSDTYEEDDEFTWIIVNRFNPKHVWTNHGWEDGGTPIEFPNKNVMLPPYGEWHRSPNAAR